MRFLSPRRQTSRNGPVSAGPLAKTLVLTLRRLPATSCLATIASSGLMFFTPGLICPSVETITYKTTGGVCLTARKAEDWVSLSLAAAEMQPVAPVEEERLSGIINRCFGKDVRLHSAVVGLGPFAQYLLVEIDLADDLAGSQVQPEILVSSCRCV